MKKLLPVLLFAFMTVVSLAQQCYTGPNNITPLVFTNPGFEPPSDSVACITQGSYVSDTLYFSNFSSFSGVTVDSIHFDSIGNLPQGLCWTSDMPNNTFNGGESGAFLFQGTTTAAPGQYSAQIFFTAYLAGGITVGPDANANTLAGLYYWLRVSCPGNACTALDTINGKTNIFIPYSSCPPTYYANIIGPSSICAGNSATLTATSDSTIISYQWSNAETTQSIAISPTSTSNYSVTVTDISGGTASANFNISVSTPPVAMFSLTPDSTPHVWDILNQSTGSGLIYTWIWGDGDTTTTTSPTLSHTYANAGYYSVCVFVSDVAGCSASYCDTSVYLFKDQSGGVIQLNVLQYPAGINTISTSTQHISYYAGAVHFSEAVTAPASIRLYDMSGREVLSQEGFTGNLLPINTPFAQGVYIIHLQNNSYSISRKLPILQ